MCKQILKSGKKCKARNMINSDFCFYHNPETKNELHRASAKGGKQNQHKAQKQISNTEIKSISDVPKILIDCITEIRNGNIEVIKSANAIGYLSNILLRAFELTELSNRIALIERKLINTNNNDNALKFEGWES